MIWQEGKCLMKGRKIEKYGRISISNNNLLSRPQINWDKGKRMMYSLWNLRFWNVHLLVPIAYFWLSKIACSSSAYTVPTAGTRPPLNEREWAIIHHAGPVRVGRCHMSSNFFGSGTCRLRHLRSMRLLLQQLREDKRTRNSWVNNNSRSGRSLG